MACRAWILDHEERRIRVAGDDGLFARDSDGKPLVWDKKAGALAAASRIDIAPALVGEFTLADVANHVGNS